MTMTTEPAYARPGAPAPLDQPLYDATFGQSVSRFFRKYATFSGRAGRAEFWWAYLFQYILGMISGVLISIGVIIVVFAMAFDAAEYETSTADAARGFAVAETTIEIFFAVLWVTLAGLALTILPTLLPSIAVTVRRLHDTNRSGWWYLLTLVPFVGYAVLVFAVLEPDPAGARFDRR